MEKVIRKLFFIVLFIFSFSLFGKVNVVSRTENSIKLLYKFDKINFIKEGEYDYIKIEDTRQLACPGEPIIPVRVVKVLIPQGKEIDKINVVYNYRKFDGSYTLNTAQIPQRIGTNSNYRKLKFSGIFPESNYTFKGIQRFKGYKILLLQIYPVRYNSQKKEVEISKDIYVEITFKESLKKIGEKSLNVRRNRKDEEDVKKIVDNPDDITTYQITKYTPLAEYKYVVITSENLKNYFTELINSKTSRGISAIIITVEDICDNPGSPYYKNGRDRAEQIRNFIIWAYNNWNTQYVLLGGDVDVIPIRYFYNPVEGSSNPIPTDMYYSNLDGTFDFDNDGVYGEPNDGVGGGDIDFLPEVYVGRAPVETPEETNNFVNKVLSYLQNNTKDLKRTCMIGKQLDDIPTWGGDGKDEVAKIFPDDWTIAKFYDRDNTFSKSDITSCINNGIHFINIFTHGSHSSCATFSNSEIRNLFNLTYPIVYSQGCYNASLDEPGGDAIGEVFVISSNAGVAFVGNTRYGWYSPGAVEYGPSQIFDEEFFNVLFKENFPKLGDAFYRSKANLSGSLYSYTRYVYYELILLGDPEIDAITPVSTPPVQNQGYVYYVKDGNIYEYDFETNETTQITHFLSGDILNPVLSEDGEKILFSYSDGGDYQLYWINSDGSGLENLSEKYNLNQATKNQEYGALNSDKTLLAFAAESIESMPGGKQIWLKELTGQKRLYQLTFENWDCSYPVFIDDSHILFRVDEVNSTLQDYYIVSTTGAEPTNITYNSQLSPYFPKLGRPMLNSEKTMIIYGKQTQDASGYSDWEIYTRNVSGGEASNVLSEFNAPYS